MKDARGQRSVHVRLYEHITKMLNGARATGCDQRNTANGAYFLQLLNVIPVTHTIAPHAVEYDFSSSAILHFAHPLQYIPSGLLRSLGVTAVLIRAVSIRSELTVYSDDDALRTEACAERVNQRWVCQRRGVDRDFLCTGIQNRFCILNGSNSTGHAEGDIEHSGNTVDPLPVHGPALRAGGDVVEDELVRAFVAIARGQLHDVAHDLEVAEADALDYLPVADIEAGDDAFCKNGRSSSDVISPSSNALPLTAPATPVLARAAKSDASRTPPDACHCR